MAKELDMLGHIIEIKEKIARIEAHAKSSKEASTAFVKEQKYMREDIDEIQSDTDKMKGSMKVLKWVAPSGSIVLVIILKLLDYL